MSEYLDTSCIIKWFKKDDDKLERYGVLLILGEPHLGKTYTTLNLLYDYYVEGFDVDFKPEIYRKEAQQEICIDGKKS